MPGGTTINPKGPHCKGCPLEKIGQGFALTAGEPRHGVAIFAEALGEDEAKVGVPLVGRAGSTFNRMLSRTQDPDTLQLLRREDFLLGNVVNCRPPDNFLTKAPYEFEAIEHCSPYLKETLGRSKPRVIFTMGNQPLRRFTGHWGIDSLRGYVFKTPYGIVVPSYHPSYIQRGKWQYVRVWQLDLQKALHIARAGAASLEAPKRYITHPTIADVEGFYQRWIAAGCPPLSFDIETPHSKELKGERDKDEEWMPEFTRIEDDPSYHIFCISLSFAPYEAISIPWIGGFIPLVQGMLGMARVLVVWNRHFDVPRLEYNGVRFNGRIYDGMDLWHFLEPSLRMGLKYVATFLCPDMQPWKLMSKEQPEWYNAADSDVALRCFLSMRERCEKEGRWSSYERHVVDLLEILRRSTSRGILVDVELRRHHREAFEAELSGVVEKMQPLIPDEVKPFKVYKSSEEKLRKEGKWVEGRMRTVKSVLTEKEISALIVKKQREEVKRQKEAEKKQRKVERDQARALKKALQEEKKSKKLGTSTTGKRRKKNPSKSSSASVDS